MKKRLLIASTLLIAGLTQAASIAWGIGNPNAFVTTSPAGGTLSNYVAYLCVGTKEDAQKTLATITSGAEWTAPAIGQGDTIVQKNVSLVGSIDRTSTTVLASNFTNGETYNFYVVLFDETSEYVSVSSVLSGTTFNEMGQDPATSVVWREEGAMGAISNGWQKIVPEPTALALLALGVAGVALRRRIR